MTNQWSSDGNRIVPRWDIGRSAESYLAPLPDLASHSSPQRGDLVHCAPKCTNRRLTPMLCNVGEVLARAYLRSRASFESARDRKPIENVPIQRRHMNAAKQKADVHARTCKICDAASIRSAAELREHVLR